MLHIYRQTFIDRHPCNEYVSEECVTEEVNLLDAIGLKPLDEYITTRKQNYGKSYKVYVYHLTDDLLEYDRRNTEIVLGYRFKEIQEK